MAQGVEPATGGLAAEPNLQGVLQTSFWPAYPRHVEGEA